MKKERINNNNSMLNPFSYLNRKGLQNTYNLKLTTNYGFTLVELIVVVTILAILSTIGFVAYSGYLAGVRDTNRVSQLKSIADGLEMYRTRHELPLPENYVEVESSGTVIAYQGYVGKNVLETIEYSSEGVDPKDGSYYSYYLTKDKKYFQLMAFLEEEDNLQVNVQSGQTHRSAPTNVEVGGCLHSGCKTANAIDYSTRYPIVYGKKLGILTDENNTPIQEIEQLVNSGYLDILDVGDLLLKSYLKSKEILVGTGTTFSVLEKWAKVGGKFCSLGNLECIDPNSEPDWIQIIKINSTISDLQKFGDTSEIESTFYSDSQMGVGWGTNDDSRKNFIINKKFFKVIIIFSGKYNDPSGGLGFLVLDNELNNSDSKSILSFSDSWTSDSSGQSLSINGQDIYDGDEINELNREELIDYGDSDLLQISMKGYTSSYPYTKRYIKELWIKVK